MKGSVCANFAHTAADGKKYNTAFYSLDMIISVGYRVNSKQGTRFRIWATQVLKKHLINGYTINENRLKKQEKKYLELKNAVLLIGNVVQFENLSGEAKGLAQVISEYAKALDILDGFDHETLAIPKGTKKAKFELTYDEAQKIIEVMRKKFKDSGLVGQEKIRVLKVLLERFIKHLGEKMFIQRLKRKLHIYYILLRKTIVLLMAINVLPRLCLSVFYRKMD